MVLDIKQKQIKAFVEKIKYENSKLNVNKNAAYIIKFFVHCRGLETMKSSLKTFGLNI